MNNKSAPIIIFTYRRKIGSLISSLLSNQLAKESDLFIFSDGYKNEADKRDVEDVRESLNNIEGFKSIAIYESAKNMGLAKSIIDGVSQIISKYDKVIVLEDDLIVSDNFLDYMNRGLDFYVTEQNIWSLSGYTPYLECLKYYKKDVFLSPRANSWGWATWKDRWESIDWNITDWQEFKKDKKAKNVFNQGGNDMFLMLEAQMLGKIDSWAIRWCYNQFKQKSYTIYPTYSKIINEGFDTKGTHNNSGGQRWNSQLSSKKIQFEQLLADKRLIQCFADRYNLKLKTKVGYFLKKYGGYKLAKKLIKIVGNDD